MATWVHDDNLKEATVCLDMCSKVCKDQKSWIFWHVIFHNTRGASGALEASSLRKLTTIYSNSVEIDDVSQAVENELKGPGQLLGYRAMHKKIRQEYGLNVTRDKVYDVMYEFDPEGLEARGGVGAKKERRKGNFTTRGANWVHSLDGHDKLMGYQNSTFPLAIYGCMDTASRKLF